MKLWNLNASDPFESKCYIGHAWQSEVPDGLMASGIVYEIPVFRGPWM
jgi:hypothetical protein